MAHCLGLPEPTPARGRRLQGETFRQGQQQAVAVVTVLRRPADASEAVAALERPSAERCVAEQFAGSVSAGDSSIRPEDVNVEEIPLTVPGARGNVYRLSARVWSPVASVEVTADVARLVSGPLDLNLVFVGVGTPVDAELRDRVTLTLGERLVSAAGVS